MFDDKNDDSRVARETESPETKDSNLLGRAVSYGARRLIDRPNLGGRRGRRRRGIDINIPTGGIPGYNEPTGSRLDPDNDGWSDEGTKNPVWVGIRRLLDKKNKKPKASRPPKDKNTSPRKETPPDRLSSGAKKPSWPRKPTYGAFVGGAEEIFGRAKTWKEFSDIYKDREIIWLDYETTGLIFDEYRKPSHNGNPLQLGLVKVKNGKITGKLNLFMNPNMQLEPWSRDNLRDADGNPITDQWLSTQMSIADAHKQLVDFAGEDAIFGVQNASFDKDVLEDALEESGISWRPYGYIDTKEISDMVLPKWNPETQDGPYKIVDGNKVPSNGLADITKYLGVDLGKKHHYATEDARAAAEVMQAIIDRAIENNWSTDLLSKEKRDAKILADKKSFDTKIEKFKIDKENWLKNNIEDERLSSGIDKKKIVKISAEEVEAIEQHRRKKYKYGDDSILHQGKQIRRDRNDWLEGMTPEQMADVLVPSSNNELFEMWLDDIAPGARTESNRKIVDAFRKYWQNHLDRNPWDDIDSSPEATQTMKNMLKLSLESNPYMRWAFEKHGAPMYAIWSQAGIENWESRKEVQEFMDKIIQQRGYSERPYTSGRLSPFIDLTVFHPKTMNDRIGNENKTIPLTMGQNHVVVSGDAHIDTSIAGRILHEWSHWLHWRAIRDGETMGKGKNRIYYGSGDITDPQYASAMSIAQQYRSHTTNPNLIKLHEDGTNINDDPAAPRTITSYAHVSLNEMIAEGISAVLHPNRNIQNSALNEKLRKDSKILLGGDGMEDEPWESNIAKEIAIRKKKINYLTKKERKQRLSSGRIDALGRETYRRSFAEKYAPEPNFKYTNGVSPKNKILAKEIAKDKLELSKSNSANFSFVDELGKTVRIFNKTTNPNEYGTEFFFAKNIADSLDFSPADFFELFDESFFPNTERFKKLQTELAESGDFLVPISGFGRSDDSRNYFSSIGLKSSFSPIDNIVTDKSIDNEHEYLKLKPIKSEISGNLWGLQSDGLFRTNRAELDKSARHAEMLREAARLKRSTDSMSKRFGYGLERSVRAQKRDEILNNLYFAKFNANSETGSQVLKTMLILSLLDEWNNSTENPISKIFKKAVSQLFSNDAGEFKEQRQMDFVRDVVKTIHEKTQDYLQGKGITHLAVYKLMEQDKDIKEKIYYSSAEGGFDEILLNVGRRTPRKISSDDYTLNREVEDTFFGILDEDELSSWTNNLDHIWKVFRDYYGDRKNPEKFENSSLRGTEPIILKKIVPIDEVFSTYFLGMGSSDKEEIILRNNKRPSFIKVMPDPRFGDLSSGHREQNFRTLKDRIYDLLTNYDEASNDVNLNNYLKTVLRREDLNEKYGKHVLDLIHNDNESTSRISSGGSSRAKIALDKAFKNARKKFVNKKYRKSDPTNSATREDTWIEALVTGKFDSRNYDSETLSKDGEEINSSVLGPDSGISIMKDIISEAEDLDGGVDSNGLRKTTVESSAKQAVVAGVVAHLDESVHDVSSLIFKRKDVIDLFPEKYRDEVRKIFKITDKLHLSDEDGLSKGAASIFGLLPDDVGSSETSVAAFLDELLDITKPGKELNLPDYEYGFKIDKHTGELISKKQQKTFFATTNTNVARQKLLRGLSSLIGDDNTIDKTRILSIFPELKEGLEFWDSIKGDTSITSDWNNYRLSKADHAQLLIERLIHDVLFVKYPPSSSKKEYEYPTELQPWIPEQHRERLASILKTVGNLSDDEMSMIGYGKNDLEFDTNALLIFSSIFSDARNPNRGKRSFGNYTIQYSAWPDSKERHGMSEPAWGINNGLSDSYSGVVKDATTGKEIKVAQFQAMFEWGENGYLEGELGDGLPTPDIKDVDLIIAAEENSAREFGGDELMPRGSVPNPPNKYTGKTTNAVFTDYKTGLRRRRLVNIKTIIHPLFGENNPKIEDIKVDVYESKNGMLHYFFRKTNQPLPDYDPSLYPKGLMKTVDLKTGGLDEKSAAVVIDRFFTTEHTRDRLSILEEQIKASSAEFGKLSAPNEMDEDSSILSITDIFSSGPKTSRAFFANVKDAFNGSTDSPSFDARTEEGQEALKTVIISNLIRSWAGSSNKVLLSTLSQEIAKELFFLNGATEINDMLTDSTAPKGTIMGVLRSIYENDETLNLPDKAKSILSNVLKAMHENTQQYFREKGISHVTVYRGMSIPISELSKEMLENGTPENMSVSMRPLSSWSTSIDVANRFSGDVFETPGGSKSRTGILLSSVVPVEDILAIPLTGFGCLNEHEIVLLGKPRQSIVITKKGFNSPSSEDIKKAMRLTPSLNQDEAGSRLPRGSVRFFEKIDDDFVKPLRKKEFELIPADERISSGAERFNSRLIENMNDEEILSFAKNIPVEFYEDNKTDLFDFDKNDYKIGIGADGEITEGVAVPRNEKGFKLSNLNLFDKNGEPTEEFLDDFIAWTRFNGEKEFSSGKTDFSKAALSAVISDDEIRFDIADIYPENPEFIDKARFFASEERQQNAVILSKLNKNEDPFIKSGATGSKDVSRETIKNFDSRMRQRLTNIQTTGNHKLRQIGTPRRIELEKSKNVRRVRYEVRPNNFEDYFIFDSDDGLRVSVFSGEQLKKYITGSPSERPTRQQLNQMIKKEKPIAKLTANENSKDFLSMFDLSVDREHVNRGLADAMIRAQHEFNANDVSKYYERLSKETNRIASGRDVIVGRDGKERIVGRDEKERKVHYFRLKNGQRIPLAVYESESDWIRERYPRPSKEDIKKINDAGNRIIKSRLNAVWFNHTQPNGEVITSPLLTVAGRQIVVVRVNGVRVPFYRSSGKNPKDGVTPGKWYPFFGIHRNGNGWFNKFKGMDRYYDIPELQKVAEILDNTIGDDLPDANKVRWNAADRKAKPELRRVPGGYVVYETRERRGVKRAIAENMNRDLPEPMPTQYFNAETIEPERIKILTNLIAAGRESEKAGFLIDAKDAIERISSGKRKTPKFKQVPSSDKRIKQFVERYGTTEKAGTMYFEITGPDDGFDVWERFKEYIKGNPSVFNAELRKQDQPMHPSNINSKVAFGREVFNKAKFVEYTNDAGKKYLIALVLDGYRRVVAIDVNELKKDLKKKKVPFRNWDNVIRTYMDPDSPHHDSSRHINGLIGWINVDYREAADFPEVISGQEYGNDVKKFPAQWTVEEAKIKAWHRNNGISKQMIKFHREIFPELNLQYRFKTDKEKRDFIERFIYWSGKDEEDSLDRESSITQRSQFYGETEEAIENRLRSGESLEAKQSRLKSPEKVKKSREIIHSIFPTGPVDSIKNIEKEREKRYNELLRLGLTETKDINGNEVYTMGGLSDSEVIDEISKLTPEEQKYVSQIIEAGGLVIGAINDEIDAFHAETDSGDVVNGDTLARRIVKSVSVRNALSKELKKLDEKIDQETGARDPEMVADAIYGITLGKSRRAEHVRMEHIPYAVDAKTFVESLRDAIKLVESSRDAAYGKSETHFYVDSPDTIHQLQLAGNLVSNVTERNEYGLHKVEFVGKSLKKIGKRGESRPFRIVRHGEDGEYGRGFYYQQKPTELVGNVTDEEKSLVDSNPSIVSDLLAIMRNAELGAQTLLGDVFAGNFETDEKTGKPIPLLQMSDDDLLQSYSRTVKIPFYGTTNFTFMSKEEQKEHRIESMDLAKETRARERKEGLSKMTDEKYKELKEKHEKIDNSNAYVTITPYIGEATIRIKAGNEHYLIDIDDFGQEIEISIDNGSQDGVISSLKRIDFHELPKRYQTFVQDIKRNLKAFTAIPAEDRKTIFLAQVKKILASDSVQSLERKVLDVATEADIELPDKTILPAGTRKVELKKLSFDAAKKSNKERQLVVEEIKKINKLDTAGFQTEVIRPTENNNMDIDELNAEWESMTFTQIENWAADRVLKVQQQKVIDVLESAGVVFSDPFDTDTDMEIYDVSLDVPSVKDASDEDKYFDRFRVYRQIRQSPREMERRRVGDDLLRAVLNAKAKIVSFLPKSLIDGSQSEVLEFIREDDDFWDINGVSQNQLTRRGKLKFVSLLGFKGRASASSKLDSDGNSLVLIKTASTDKILSSDVAVRRAWESTQLHEAVHGIESANNWVSALEYLFFMSRRKKGEKGQKLSTISGNTHYKDDEVAIKDEWLEEYAGKFYGNKFYERHTHYEILTTGMQALFFRDRDVDGEHMGFTVGLLLASAARPGNSAVVIPKSNERLSSGATDDSSLRRQIGRLMASKDTSKMSSGLLSIANDYINYRYEMNRGMAESLLRRLKNLPDYSPDERISSGRRDNDSIIKNGPISFDYGRDKRNLPNMATIKQLKTKFGNTPEKIGDYFYKTHGLHIVFDEKISKSSEPAIYGSLQAIDDFVKNLQIDKEKFPVVIIKNSKDPLRPSYYGTFEERQFDKRGVETMDAKEKELLKNFFKDKPKQDNSGGVVRINIDELMSMIAKDVGIYSSRIDTNISEEDARDTDMYNRGSRWATRLYANERGENGFLSKRYLLPKMVDDLFARLGWDYKENPIPTEDMKDKYGGIYFSEEQIKLRRKVISKYYQNIKQRATYAITIHELAHALDFAARDIEESVPGGIPDFFSELVDNVPFPTSEYGQRNNVENFAESFTTWFLFAGSPVSLDNLRYAERAEKFMKLYLEYVQASNRKPRANHSIKSEENSADFDALSISDSDLNETHPVVVFALAPLVQEIQKSYLNNKERANNVD